MTRLIALICVALTMATSAFAEGRRAFILGNSDYASLPDLENTLADAQAYNDTLGGLGFEVTYHENLDLDRMAGEFASFLATVAPGDKIVFVYSGHGWSDSATNYLIPIDAPIEGSDLKLKGASYALRNGQDGILDQLEESGAILTVAIIDACRNNPFKAPKGRKSVGMTRGLAPIDAPAGTFLIYSAGEGQEALDRLPDDAGDQRLSVFSRTFVPLLASGMALEDAISDAQVATASLAATSDGHLQTPAYYDQSLGKTCLIEGCAAVPVAVKVPPQVEDGPLIKDPPPAVNDQAGKPVLRVDASGGGDYRTITDAINAAADGTRIEIAPGTYTETLSVEKSLDFIGIGGRNQTIITTFDANVFTWFAASGRIENLTLKQTGSSYSAITFESGAADVIGNDMTSAGSAVVTVRGGANPVVTGNDIHDGNESGLFITGEARGTYTQNTIYANRFSGIEVNLGSAPDVRDNVIRNGQSTGIYIHDNATGTYSANLIESNGNAGFYVATQADPDVQNNIVRGNLAAGIVVVDGGLGSFTANIIDANAFAGIEVAREGNPDMRNNTVQNGKTAGVFVTENGKGIYTGNIITGNATAGVITLDGGSPMFTTNSVTGNAFAAVEVQTNGGGTFIENDLTGNGRGAFQTFDDSGKIINKNNKE